MPCHRLWRLVLRRRLLSFAALPVISLSALLLPAVASAQAPSLARLRLSKSLVAQAGGSLKAHFTLSHAQRCRLTWSAGAHTLRTERFACSEPGQWETGQISVPSNKSVYPRTVRLRIVAVGRSSTTREASVKQLGYRLPVAEITECERGQECDYGPILETYQLFGNAAPVNLGDCSFAAVADLEQIKYSIEPDPTLLGVQFTEAGGGESGLSQAKVWKFWEGEGGIEGYRLVKHHSYKLESEDVRALVEQQQAVLVMLQFVKGDYLGTEETEAGYHDAVVDGFTPAGPLLVTWGKTVQMTWEQWDDEAVDMWTIEAVEI